MKLSQIVEHDFFVVFDANSNPTPVACSSNDATSQKMTILIGSLRKNLEYDELLEMKAAYHNLDTRELSYYEK